MFFLMSRYSSVYLFYPTVLVRIPKLRFPEDITGIRKGLERSELLQQHAVRVKDAVGLFLRFDAERLYFRDEEILVLSVLGDNGTGYRRVVFIGILILKRLVKLEFYTLFGFGVGVHLELPEDLVRRGSGQDDGIKLVARVDYNQGRDVYFHCIHGVTILRLSRL